MMIIAQQKINLFSSGSQLVIRGSLMKYFFCGFLSGLEYFEDQFCLMANIDLSAAFDIVNVKLLLRRMRIVGLPEDVVELVDIWLSTRYYYVTIEQVNSNIRMSKDGTIRGLI